jgi:hypothetical protein
MMKSALGQPRPKRPQVLLDLRAVEFRQRSRTSFEKGSDLWILIESPTQLAIVRDATEALRVHGAHEVQPPWQGRGSCRESTRNGAPGKA